MEFSFRQRSWTFDGHAKIMGILNITPDSFSESGVNFQLEEACKTAQEMIAKGVDLIDVGGESTRPGAEPVTVEAEIQRVIPVIKSIREFSQIPISIDTYKSEVAKAALLAGADIINDITACQYDDKMASVAKEFNAGLIIMHMRGNPQTMQDRENLIYRNLREDIAIFFQERYQTLISAGISKSQLMLDPGIGFSKDCQMNIDLVKSAGYFKDELQLPILIAPSRKRFIGEITNRSQALERDFGTAATLCAAIEHGADMLRIHNPDLIDTVKMYDKLKTRGN